MASRRSARISNIGLRLTTPTPTPTTTTKGGGSKSTNLTSTSRKRKPNLDDAPEKQQQQQKKQKKQTTVKADLSLANSAADSSPRTPPRKKQDATSIRDNSALILTPSTSLLPPRLDRPVEPHRTNATLLTPRDSSLVAYPSVEDVSPSKTGLPRPIATTGNLLEKAVAHLLGVDARLKAVVEKHHCRLFSPEGLAEKVDPFASLASSIIGQQVSGAAARSIKNKFLDLFESDDDDGTRLEHTADTEAGADANADVKNNRRFPTPTQVVEKDIPTLRTAGLSQRKAEYIHGLAEKFVSGELSTEKLLRASDEEVMEMLIAVRGLGRWSVEMFSCFALKRTDVFSTGDLGVQYVSPFPPIDLFLLI